MDDLLANIEASLAAGHWTIALHGTLALPDICAALASPGGRTSGERYRTWFRDNLSGSYPLLDPEDCWQLRCGVLHTGRSQAQNYTRVVFTLPNQQQLMVHNNVINGALNLDLETFCADMIAAVRAWRGTTSADPNYQANLPNLLQLHPVGLSPYIVGVPVLA